MSSALKKKEQASRPATWEDLLNMPDDGFQYEILDGVLELVHPPMVIDGRTYNVNPPLLVHQRISALMHLRLGVWIESRRLGELLTAPTGVSLSVGQSPQPDLVFVREKRRAKLMGRQGVMGAPDLVIEVLSPSTARKDLLKKRRIYAQHHIPEYWIVDPEDCSIAVLTLSGEAYVDAKPVSGEQLIPSKILAGLPFKAEEFFPK